MIKSLKEAWFKIFADPELFRIIFKDSVGDHSLKCCNMGCGDCPLDTLDCYLSDEEYISLYTEYLLGNTTPEEAIPDLFKSMSTVDIAPEYVSDPQIRDSVKARLDAMPESDITIAENGWEKETLKGGKVKTMYQLVDPYFHEGIADILTLGAQKYKPNNWVDGSHEEYSRAVESHWIEYKKGNKLDKESGLSHLYHIACNLMFLDYFDRKEEELEEIKAEVHENVQKTYMKG